MSGKNDTLVVERDSIHLRRHATDIMREADSQGCRSLSLENVDFVSRSVADELIHLSREYNVSLENMQGDAEKIIETVSSQLPVAAD